MGYIKKSVREKLVLMDDNNTMPKKWDKFIDEVRINHNLLIKGRKNLVKCTNCDFEFISKKEIGKYDKCPNCKNTYQIRSNKLKSDYFIDRIILINRIKGELVYRYFEIYSRCNKNNNYKSSSSVTEFARTFPRNYTTVVNERMSKCQCNIYINHYGDPKKWREYTRNYGFGEGGYVYPYNFKEVFSNTKWKYINFTKFIKKVNPISFNYLYENCMCCDSFEMLIKLKLYNLAVDASKFASNGSFNQIFGISKDYYEFMKRNNITFEELKILRTLKEKNIRKVRYLNEYDRDEIIDEIVKYISINKLYDYLIMNKGDVHLSTYRDYLKFAKALGLDLNNKKYVFPDNLQKRHDELEKYYKIHNRKILNNLISKRYELLKENIYKDKNFIIIPAKSVEALEDESRQQSNCVRTYSEKYAEGKADIYFMRLLKSKNKSLVTVEVRNNRVVQSRTKYNNSLEEKQLKFLKLWETKILQKCLV